MPDSLRRMNSLLHPRGSSGFLLALSLALLATAAPRPAAAAESLKTESRMPFRHVIPLRDHAGDMIQIPAELDEQGKPQEARGNPYSTAQTCGKCHEYAVIGQGWHFNAGRTDAKPGRPGEPWILTDAGTRTQIPISYRGWEGTFKPADVGLSDFDFLVAFGRHHPGGGMGEPARDKIDATDARLRRFLVTGGLEIDCLICHARNGEYDHEARYKAIANEDFRWAATIAGEFGAYGASRHGKAFADAWRPPRPAPTNFPPVKYERRRFDGAQHTTVEVARRAPSENCYFCHTSMSEVGDARWHGDQDVHLRAGMSCTDCHRNGIDHQVVRGYEGETGERPITDAMIAQRVKVLLRDDAALKEPEARTLAESQLKAELGKVETLSCRGCHYGSADAKFAGRLGAPHPEHHGFPPLHFEKLSCTACHSGPIPEDATRIVHTSLAHKLGLPGPTRGANTAPAIVQPVFLRDVQGKIAPHKMVWPSYWGYLRDGKVKPMLPDEVARVAGEKLPGQARDEVERDPYHTKPMEEARIKDVLAVLEGAPGRTNGEPVFVASGKLFRLDGGNVKSEEHAAAKPYAWAVGHDVRPVSQALGAKGCGECHGKDSPIYYATVLARGPVDPSAGLRKAQWELRGDDEQVASIFAFTFNFRPLLKIMTFACALVVLGVLAGRLLVWLGGGRRGAR